MDEEGTEKKEVSGVVRIFYASLILVLGGVIGAFVYLSSTNAETRFPFKLGLDLAGGSHLVYEADVSAIVDEEVENAMATLREVIERRVNIFGVSEPLVQVEQSSFVAGEQRQRLVVELPGVTDVAEAVAAIGQTPLLEFKILTPGSEVITGEGAFTAEYEDTGLTGRFLENAELVFGQAHGGGLANEPIVIVNWDGEGSDLFADITTRNVGKQIAIFLDGELVSSPVVREPITGGSATISGGFTPEEARDLVRNLNFGALPLPIELESTQTIGATLGGEVLEKGVRAGGIGLLLVLFFMLIYYRLPGLVAGVALLIYLASMLALFKLIPVVLTAAGLAGLVLSLGMAVDANVLVFERMKEEYRAGKGSREAARTGFARAWPAIRDSNLTSILAAIVLFWLGTSLVKGFALVFGLGVLLSMLSAVTVTRTLLLALPEKRREEGVLGKLYNAGFKN